MLRTLWTRSENIISLKNEMHANFELVNSDLHPSTLLLSSETSHSILFSYKYFIVIFFFLQTDLQTKAKDLSFVKSRDQVKEVLNKFLPSKLEHIKKIIDRLHRLRASLQASPFFANHEVVGSSLLIVYDESKVGVWMIDFAKTVPLPNGIDIDHSSPWIKGNHEDGYLFGLDNLIDILEELLIE